MCCWSFDGDGSRSDCCATTANVVSMSAARSAVNLFFICAFYAFLWLYSTQSAMKTFVSPCDFAFRFDAKTSFFPSGENIGNPSNVSL